MWVWHEALVWLCYSIDGVILAFFAGEGSVAPFTAYLIMIPLRRNCGDY